MTSDTWPYALNSRGHPIVTCFLDAGVDGEIATWRSYVVLPKPAGKSEFNYEAAAFRAGWKRAALGGWFKPGELARFAGDVRELCFYIGVGPDWEAWGHQTYRERLTS